MKQPEAPSNPHHLRKDRRPNRGQWMIQVSVDGKKFFRYLPTKCETEAIAIRDQVLARLLESGRITEIRTRRGGNNNPHGKNGQRTTSGSATQANGSCES